MSPESKTNKHEKPLTWDEAQQHFQRHQSKTVKFGLGKGQSLSFKIRQLSQAERDEAEEAGLQMTRLGRRTDAKLNTGALKAVIIRHGVVEGPTGWTSSDRDISLLPPDIRDQLADDIDAFSALDDETFRGLR